MSRSDTEGRVHLARGMLVIEVRRMVDAKPGEYPQLELRLRELYDAQRARALYVVAPDRTPPQEAA